MVAGRTVGIPEGQVHEAWGQRLGTSVSARHRLSKCSLDPAHSPLSCSYFLQFSYFEVSMTSQEDTMLWRGGLEGNVSCSQEGKVELE